MSLSDTALVTLNQAKNYLRADAAASLEVAAEYVGMGDGGTVEFTLDHTPLEGTLKLYVNGVLQVKDTDFTLSTATITFETAPTLNYAITASYVYAAGDDTFESFDDTLLEQLIEGATLAAEKYTERAFVQRSITERHHGDGTDILRLWRQPIVSITSVSYERVVGKKGDGSTVAFDIGDTPKTDSLTVYKDGVLLTVTTDYTLSGQTVTFVATPADAARLVFRFNVPLYVVDDYTEWLHIGRLKGSWLNGYEYEVVYTAGYGADRAAAQSAIPQAVTAVLITIANWYENRLAVSSESVTGIGTVNYGGGSAGRQNVSGGALDDMPSAAKKILDSIKV